MSKEKRGDDFLFAKISEDKEMQKKPRGGYSEPDYDDYELDPDLKEREQEGVATQLHETAEVMNEKTLRNEDEVFYTIFTKAKTSELEVKTILNGLKAEVIAYLDRTKHGILVSGTDKKLNRFLEKPVPKYLGEKVRIIKALSEKEQLDETLYKDGKRIQMAIFAIVPNLSKDKQGIYTEKLADYFVKNEVKTYAKDLRKLGFVLADVTFSTIRDILKKSTFIFKVGKIPDSVASSIRVEEKINESAKSSETKLSNPYLPSIVVADSGVNCTSQLSGFIKKRDSDYFQNPDDEYGKHGHGTPIAHLAVFGESQKDATANIISYKIFSDYEQRYAYRGLVNAIEKFSSETRLFVTSIGIPGLLDIQVVQLDRLVQEKNICLVASAGNIEYPAIQEYLQSGSQYPQYLKFFPVLPPATGVDIVAVGSIAKKIHPSLDSLAQYDNISPHSRCGKGAFDLKDCKKPEVVEHGGNVNLVDRNFNLNSDRVGVNTIDKNGNPIDLSGTSYSSPLFVRRLAQIERKYHSKIKNSETLLAISYLSCDNKFMSCGGYGEPNTLTECDFNSAIYLAENKIGFPYVDDKNVNKPYNEITIYVPPDVEEIKVCIVHSDNLKKAVSPTLETELEVKAKKLGNQSVIPPFNRDESNLTTNTKFLVYKFDSKSMESMWTFRVRPKTIHSIQSEDKKQTTVRYGCAILLKAKLDRRSKKSLTGEIMEKMGRLF